MPEKVGTDFNLLEIVEEDAGAADRATEARKHAHRLSCQAGNKRMLGFRGPAQRAGQAAHARLQLMTFIVVDLSAQLLSPTKP